MVRAQVVTMLAGASTNRMPDLVDRVVRRILTEIEFYRDRPIVYSLGNFLSRHAELTLASGDAAGARRALQGLMGSADPSERARAIAMLAELV